MESKSDKDWATKYLLSPLTSAEPVDETGPGTHFGNTMAVKKPARHVKVDDDRASRKSFGYPSPPQSASPSRSAFPEYKEDATDSRGVPSPRQSSEIPTSTVPSAPASSNGDAIPPRRRGSSLGARFPGDRSHRPLDMLRDEARTANRHTRRSHIVGADTIDQLDRIGANGIPYHHDGPYDATLLGRNLSPYHSPVAATADTNSEAIRATPREFIVDSVEGHRPLAGTATVPPGVTDRYGRVLNYREGPNLNVEMGWRRWEGIDYHPDDIKGKGEPYFTIDRALKKHDKVHRRIVSDGGIELVERARSSSNPYAPVRGSRLKNASDADVGSISEMHEEPYSEWADAGIRRANTTGKRTSGMASSLRSRFGSLRRRRNADGESRD